MPDIPSLKSNRIRARDRVLEVGDGTLVMGILNVTPDSFSDGGRFQEPERALARAWQIADEGADILDVGAESTRPGSEPVSTEEELRRLLPVLDGLDSRYPLVISVDTCKPEVARAALERGASIINDVTALGNPQMGSAAAEFGAAVVLMHMRGEPRSMHLTPPSPNILEEIVSWGQEAVERAQNSGVSCDKIILDPGIGFGKTAAQNLEILRSLDRLAALGFPLLVGTSKKSFIGAVLNNPRKDAIWGTAATVAASIIFGAHIVRVHDVAAMREIVRITDAIMGKRSSA